MQNDATLDQQAYNLIIGAYHTKRTLPLSLPLPLKLTEYLKAHTKQTIKTSTCRDGSLKN